MRCTQCGWPGDESRVLSTHLTSQGWVRYRRCVCGTVAIELVTPDTWDGMQVEPVREPADAPL
jgi:hypothetical protein